MSWECTIGLMLPFLGTALGAAAVFFIKGRLPQGMQRILTGFAAGVMTAAGVWSLLIPALERSAAWGKLSFLLPSIGLWSGVGFLVLSDRLIPRLLPRARGTSPRKRLLNLVLAVTLHNLPEGMAVGVILAGLLKGLPGISTGGVITLAAGIALQNFPEGAIISLPLGSRGMKKSKAFGIGVLSGIVEPIGAGLALLAAGFVGAALPVFLGFAAGAMLFVVAKELVPEATEDGGGNVGAAAFALGFTVMMALDVALG